MPASKAEQVMDALKALLETVPDALVQRNSVLPEQIPDGGLIMLRDGDPGEPEQALGGFRFKDWTDYKATGQLLGTGDDTQAQFQLAKQYPSGSVIEVRTITKPVAGTVKVYLDSVEQLSGWSVDTTTIDDIGDVVISAAAFGQMLRFNGSSWVNEDSPYDVGMFIPGIHGNGALLAQVVLTRAVSFADDFAGARAYAGVTATAETVLDVHRNGSPIGTITFGIGASTGSFATVGGGAETFAASDRLAIINEDPADATLADLSITFLGKRT